MSELQVGVSPPSSKRARKRINDKLIKIKDDILQNEQSGDNSDSEPELTQPIRPQQFYAELDESLDRLNRDDYIKELMRLCCRDYLKISDYRDRLAERAQSMPNCPQSRLVNRRNSASGSREEKCAGDCYILYAFNHGVHNREILDVFSNSNVDESIMLNSNDDNFVSPDVYGILNKLQSDITDIKKRQAGDSIVIESVRTDVSSVLTLFRSIHGTLNSVLSRVGSIANSVAPCNQLSQDCERMEVTLSSMNDKLSNCEHSYEKTPRTHALDTDTAPVNTCAERTTPKSFASIVASTSTPPARPAVYNAVSKVQETTNIGNIVADNQHSEPFRDETTSVHAASGFKAARRKNIVSYFVGNIDIDTTKQDIHDYMKGGDVAPTFINIFYGKYGAAAKINVHVDDEYKINKDRFWPNDITLRKWVSKEEWEKEKPRRRRRPQRHTYRHNFNSDHQDYERYDTRGPRFRRSDHTGDHGYNNRRNSNRHDTRANHGPYYDDDDYNHEYHDGNDNEQSPDIDDYHSGGY